MQDRQSDNKEIGTDPLPFSTLQIQDLRVGFKDRSGSLFRGRSFDAIRDVCLDIQRGDTLCLLGESGSGKTTLAWALLGLHPFHRGRIVFNGQAIEKPNDTVHRRLLAVSQMVFQKPDASLNPHFSLGRSIAEPLRAKGLSKTQCESIVRSLAHRAGLSVELLQRRPAQVSGGQNQRACIARALSNRPALLILDEPLTALDAVAQRRMGRLLGGIKEKFGLTYLLITHDLAMAKRMGTCVAVMYLGTIVEKAPAGAFFANPRHPYARALLSSTFTPGLWQGQRIALEGEIPSIQTPPRGCVFHPRCPVRVNACDEAEPQETVVGSGHVVRCHRFQNRV